MSQHPYQMEHLGKIRYERLLQEAEAERYARQRQETRPQLAQRAGALLIALGQKLGGQEQPAPRQPAQPAWRLK